MERDTYNGFLADMLLLRDALGKDLLALDDAFGKVVEDLNLAPGQESVRGEQRGLGCERGGDVDVDRLIRTLASLGVQSGPVVAACGT